jgi:membrane-associated phospholipid phosphatase
VKFLNSETFHTFLQWLRLLESRSLVRIQSSLLTPRVMNFCRALGFFGEHAQGWFFLGFVCLLFDLRNSALWLTALFLIAISQSSSMVLKRMFRRRRPDDSRLLISGKIFGKNSFPSSHAASSATAAVVFLALLPVGLGLPIAFLATLVSFSRLVVGVHFPSDILMGALLGLGVPALFVFLGGAI